MRTLILSICLGAVLLSCGHAQIQPEMLMTIESPAFGEGAMIPREYTCEGDDVSPPLRFGRVPEAAKSLVLVVIDGDAPQGSIVHWLLWNIPPDQSEIDRASVPAGARQGRNDFRKVGYTGPCPPAGVHRYHFRLYALGSALNLAPGATREQLDAAMKGHVLMEAQLTGKYSKAAGTTP